MSYNNLNNDDYFDTKEFVLRLIYNWPFFLISLIISISSAFIYLRYTDYQYESQSVIEIIDKAQDSEMALPTAMTIFNRSMINLDNEFGKLNSYDLNKNIVSKLKSNVRFFSSGRIKDNEEYPSDFSENYEITYNINTDTITSLVTYKIILSNNGLEIFENITQNDQQNLYNFNSSFSTKSKKHNLPFDLTINNPKTLLEKKESYTKLIYFYPFDEVVQKFISDVSKEQYDSRSKNRNRSYYTGSDQIILKINHPNKKIAEEYLLNLINEFDYDGILDRQAEYERTIKFVEKRSKFLEKEVEVIENSKQDFKKKNNLADIKTDASLSIDKQYDYDSDLFIYESQKDLVKILKDELSNNKFSMLPSNFGLDDVGLNEIIAEFNLLVKQRLRLLSFGAGKNNANIKNLENQIENFYQNILLSIESYIKSIDIKISNAQKKGLEYQKFYSEIPEKERILRDIERELTVKEALYTLLLQKKEEASINLAVVKPSIKVIDSPRSSIFPVYPRNKVTFLVSIFIGLTLPAILLSIWFFLDNKIHTREDIEGLGIPILGELPYIKELISKDYEISELEINSRSPILEAVRMLYANLKYIIRENKAASKSILVTSSIKGEGKTLVAFLLSKIISFSSKKVILLGSDLRNPQLHKYLKTDRNVKGLSDYIYRDDINFQELILKNNDNLDIILSGTIPPNPSELLESNKFKNLIEALKKQYDFVIIDSAPCLLVADTLQFSKSTDIGILIMRANHTTKEIMDFVKDLDSNKKFNHLGIVLNGLGSSSKYGYKYSYSYNYRYSYNYGYGYGYQQDKD